MPPVRFRILAAVAARFWMLAAVAARLDSGQARAWTV